MAFVHETMRDNTYLDKSTTGAIGPGEYHNEGLKHKQAMEKIYPKKQVPFNTQLDRQGQMRAIGKLLLL